MKNTDTPSIERLKELLAKASKLPWEIDTEHDPDAEYGSGPDPDRGFDDFIVFDGIGQLLFGTATSNAKCIVEEPHSDEYGDREAWDETGKANVTLIVEAINALPHLIATLETLPSAGAGVERRICSICTAVVASYPEGMCCHCQELPWPLTPSPPLEQPDIEGRARELRQLARKLGREYGVGVMDDVLAALKGAADDLERLSLPTTEIRRGALEEAAAVAQRACEQRKEWALRGFGDRSQEEDRAAVASLIAKEIRALASKEPSPPSRPSFDKWDYARAVLDAARCGE